jgi:hypothetical protein
MAETYFLMKNYELAHKYYSKIDDENHIDYNNMALSIIYKNRIDSSDFERS